MFELPFSKRVFLLPPLSSLSSLPLTDVALVSSLLPVSGSLFISLCLFSSYISSICLFFSFQPFLPPSISLSWPFSSKGSSSKRGFQVDVQLFRSSNFYSHYRTIHDSTLSIVEFWHEYLTMFLQHLVNKKIAANILWCHAMPCYATSSCLFFSMRWRHCNKRHLRSSWQQFF